MVNFSQLPFTCSQEEDYVGSGNFFGPPTQSESVFRSYIQHPSSTSRALIGKNEPCENNSDVQVKEVEEHEDCQIIELTKKRRGGPTKKKALTKKRAKKVKVEEEDTEEKKKRGGPAKKKALTKKKAKKVKVEEEDTEEEKKNWPDSDVEQLIAIRDEMHAEFEKNAKKQGVDTWIRLQARMLVVIFGFPHTSKACRKKFETIFMSYKKYKLANSVSGNDKHECKFYNSLDQWWHQAGSIMKHVSATTLDTTDGGTQDDNEDVAPDASQDLSHEHASQSKPSPPPKKAKFQDQALLYFGKMVDNGTAMLEHFGKTNELLEKVDHRMDHLIDKL